MKRCTKCGQYKQEELFPSNPQTKDGYYSWCKECKRESEATRNKNKVIEKLTRPKVCGCCLKQEPEVEFETRAKKLCKTCKEQSVEKEIVGRRVKTKVCKICGKQKSINKYQSSLHKICSDCEIIPEKEQKTLLEKWKRKRFIDKKRRYEYKEKIIKELGGKCNNCGIKPSEEWPVVCFDFHHCDGKKEHNISVLINTSKRNKTIIENEIKKCIILCSNCHRKLHAYRKDEVENES
jgi:hypothetical protein